MIDINTFRGMIPKVSPRLLPNEAALMAKNTKFVGGELVPINGKFVIHKPLVANAKTLFLYKREHWFSWNTEVNAARSPSAGDNYERVYFTGFSDEPKVTDKDVAIGSGVMPNGHFRIGVPVPEPELTYVKQAGTGKDIDPHEYRFYAYTFVNQYGEEGPLSKISAMLTMTKEDDWVKITGNVTQTGNYSLKRIRIYRSSSFLSAGDMYLVADIDVSTNKQITYDDKKNINQLGPINTTDRFLEPPKNMKGLMITKAGVAIGFEDNTIIPSEPYLPYAYPLEYRRGVSDKIVALGELSNGVAVLTDGFPALLTGASPDGFSLDVIEERQACVSSRSVVEMGDFVLYASGSGLVQIGTGGAFIATQNILSKQQWHAFKPDTIHGYYWEKKYIGFYGAQEGSFIFDPQDGTFILCENKGMTGYNDPYLDRFYSVFNNVLTSFDTNPASTYTMEWESKPYITPPMTFGAVRVRAPDLTGLTLEVYADGKMIKSLTLTGKVQSIRRIPSVRGREWKMKIKGKKPVQQISLAGSLEEF